MVLQTNISALNANRQLNIVRKTGSKSTEKLASGYRINRAADDAAGLSISEKMRRQIRGLSQAGENVEDGISLCQVADGAIAEMQDMTNRMNELCVQAANGTNSADDRSYIQMEIDGIVTEFDRIIQTTKFNEVYVLKGGGYVQDVYAQDFELRTIKRGGPNGIASTPGISAWTGTTTLGSNMDDTDYRRDDPNWVVDAESKRSNRDFSRKACAWIDFTDFRASSKDEFTALLDGQGFDSSCTNCTDKYYGIKFVSSAKDLGQNPQITGTPPVTGVNPGISYIYNTTFANGKKTEVLKIDLGDIWERYRAEGSSLGEAICTTLMDVISHAGNQQNNSNLTSHYTSYAYKKGTGKFYIASNTSSGAGSSTFKLVAREDSGNEGTAPPEEYITIKVPVTKLVGTVWIQDNRQLAIHAGADADLVNKVIMHMPSMSKESLYLDKVSVTTEELATKSIDVLSDTLRFLSEDRSRIGAYQNRLEHTSLNLDNIVENTTDSESKIRDTDMAEEMVRYSNNNILAQACQSMLSQANASRQGVLSLLSG